MTVISLTISGPEIKYINVLNAEHCYVVPIFGIGMKSRFFVLYGVIIAFTWRVGFFEWLLTIFACIAYIPSWVISMNMNTRMPPGGHGLLKFF